MDNKSTRPPSCGHKATASGCCSHSNESSVDFPAPDGPTKHTAIGVGLNLLLLAMIGYGYWRSEDWKWTWVLVGIPITIVTLRYAWHLLRSRP